MQVKVTLKKDSSQVEIDITVPAAQFAPYLDKAAKKLSKDHPLDGFRPGHAPKDKVIEVMGQERLLREAMDQALPRFFVDAVVENSLAVISRPNIAVQSLGLDTDLRFIATAHVVPEVTVGDPKKIKVAKRVVEVTDAEIDDELKYLAKSRGTQIEVARPAQTGDMLSVDFHVTIDGHLVEGGQSTNHPVHLGEGHFIPEFEQKLLGIQAGETRQFVVNFPTDFPREEYRGQAAEIWVKTHSVAQHSIPEVNDEFAKTLGKFEGLDHLKAELKKGITKEKERKEKERLRGEITRELVKISTFETFPEVLIEQEINHQLEELVQFLSLQQKTLESYLFEEQKTIQDVRNDLKPQALENLKTSLVLRAFADQVKVEVSPEDVEKKTTKYLEQFASAQHAHEKISPDELRTNIASMLRSQQALKRLEQEVTITEEKEPVVTKEVKK